MILFLVQVEEYNYCYSTVLFWIYDALQLNMHRTFGTDFQGKNN
jgi:hypothetical protein